MFQCAQRDSLSKLALYAIYHIEYKMLAYNIANIL